MKTKIIATIGPASSTPEVLRRLILAGVDVFRLNFSHGNHQEMDEIIRSIRKLNAELNTFVPILADLSGPKIRIGEIPGGSLTIPAGGIITFTTEENQAKETKIFINYPHFPRDVRPGQKILLDDGKLTFEIISTDKVKEVTARAILGGILSSRKGVNLPETELSLPSLTEKDLIDLKFVLAREVEWIALSFVRKGSDMRQLRESIDRLKPSRRPFIIAKIEKPEAVKNISEIIDASDAVMIARGDLGIEVPLQEVPLIQKQIVGQCIKHATPVIVATQMMEGMISNSRPTRAEVNDVANSVMDGADALMLSGETSIGNFPVEVVETMQKIISAVENYQDIYHRMHPPVVDNNPRFMSDSLIFAAVDMAREAKAKALVTLPYSGYSAIRLSSHRPKSEIYAFGTNHHLLRQLNLVWGIKPFYIDQIYGTDQTLIRLTEEVKTRRLAFPGDLIIHVSSFPVHQPGNSNMLQITRLE